jgi:hypothetical protein
MLGDEVADAILNGPHATADAIRETGPVEQRARALVHVAHEKGGSGAPCSPLDASDIAFLHHTLSRALNALRAHAAEDLP